MTNERDLLVDIAATARRLFPEAWEEATIPAHVSMSAWLALGAKLKRLEKLRGRQGGRK